MSTIRFTTHSSTDAFVLLDLCFCHPSKFAEIQLALSTKDGMANHVSTSLAHLALSTMELTAFVQIQTADACHGNSLMEKNVFTSKILALKEPDGMELCVLQLLEIVQTVIINKETNANHYLKNVFLLPHGITTNVSQVVDLVLTEQLEEQIVVNPIVLARMAKLGTPTIYSAHVQKELDGVEQNALFALVDKYGMLKRDALALKDTSCLEPDAKSQLPTCVN